jgi:IS30 family transposase
MVAALEKRPTHSGLPDNGSKFARHRKMAAALHTQLCFADPHAPWERGGNENNNGRVRFFFPKGTDDGAS